MTITEPASSVIPGLCLPPVPGAQAVRRHVRTRRPGEVNLKSCELLHPEVDALHAGLLRAIDPGDVVFYPLYQSTLDQVGAHLGVPSDRILISAGSDSAIALLITAFARGGRLVIHNPSYEGWQRYAALNGTAIDFVTPDADGEPAVCDLLRAVTAGPPAMVVLTQPHSPTGRVFDGDEIARLSAAVAKHGSLLVLDTCYLAFSESGEQTVREVALAPHVVRVNSFSKAFGVAGARLAAVVADPRLEGYLARWQPEGAVSGVSLALLRGALSSVTLFQGIWEELRGGRQQLADRIQADLPGWHARPSGGNFVAFDVPTAAEAGAAYSHLLEHGIRTRDLSGLPGLTAALRIGLAATPILDQVARTMARFADLRQTA